MEKSKIPLPASATPQAIMPELKDSINSILIGMRNLSSPMCRADLNLALVGLIMLISREQHGSHSTSPNYVTRELISNHALFQSILSLLSSKGTYNGNDYQSYCSTQLKHGRKRSPSDDVSVQSILKKQTLTPPQKWQQINSTGQPSLSHTSITCNLSGEPDTVQNHQVFAAVILYSALQHANYWPIQLMRAYGDDAFGSRTWVDNNLCKNLVANLEVSLHCSAPDEDIDEEKVSLADEAEEYFLSLMSQATSQKHFLSKAAYPSKKRGPYPEQTWREGVGDIPIEDSASSSSGEEEILEYKTANTKIKSTDSAMVESNLHKNASTFSSLNDLFFSGFHLKSRTRPRYIGHSLDLAYEAISDALTDRLNSKSKQNSRLLLVLPSFLCIPRVRCLASRHLEKWLQSPALAGLARNLFSEIGKHVLNVDPPLPDDVEVITNVLKMNIKTSQFSSHVENITRIAMAMPMQAITQQIFHHCLQGDGASNGDNLSLNPSKNDLQILRSVYLVVDRRNAIDAIASAIISLTAELPIKESLNGQFLNICRLLRTVVMSLGDDFDCFYFVEAVIKSKSGSTKDEVDIRINTRLILECAMLIPTIETARFKEMYETIQKSTLNSDVLACFRQRILQLRKLLLRWCLSELCPRYYTEIAQEEQTNVYDTYNGRGAVTTGPGDYNFHSFLYKKSFLENRCPSFNELLSIIRSLIFLIPAKTSDMNDFPLIDLEFDAHESDLTKFYCECGVDIDDEMFHIILNSAHITPLTAIALIENLLLGCSYSNAAAGTVACSTETIWKMYKLAEYTPEIRVGFDREVLNIPRLAHPSHWWRITSIVLVVCSFAQNIAFDMWNEHPTLRDLIKMTTSQKYRFPTADCDDFEKERVRSEEANVREQESKIVELLFHPSKGNKTNCLKTEPITKPSCPDIRSSARQREKQAKIISIEQERKAVALHAERIKIRRQLHTLQKSIMIWDPKLHQRKPPKRSLDILLSVNKYYNLAQKFRMSIKPDFLLLTVGDGRSAIERSYDWLIPIISSCSEIIDRLKSSASCFLLLRAYEAEGNKNKDLLALSSPLLSHVSKCLRGECGENSALLALELLLTDLADESSHRRQCSRKVLQEAIGNKEKARPSKSSVDLCLCGWMQELQNVVHSKVLIPLTVKYVSRALVFERGTVLSIYILSLFDYKAHLKLHNIDNKLDLVELICELISARPHVCSDAMNRNPKLRYRIVEVVSNKFDEAFSCCDSIKTPSPLIVMTIPTFNVVEPTKVIEVSSSSIRAAIIILSNWEEGNVNHEGGKKVSDDIIMHLITILLIPNTSHEIDCEVSNNMVSGLASARYKHRSSKAIAVKEWVLLVKARSNVVGKNAALSVPIRFLPRLLLCCGISQVSYFTMLHRLNEIGYSSMDSSMTFRNLMSSTAIAEWGLSRSSNRRMIKRKIYGRILAYIRIFCKNSAGVEVQSVKNYSQSPFVSWLLSEFNPIGNKKHSHIRDHFSVSDSYNAKPLCVETMNDVEICFSNWDEDSTPTLNCSLTDNCSTSTGAVNILQNGAISDELFNMCLNNHELDKILNLMEGRISHKNEFNTLFVAKRLLSIESSSLVDAHLTRVILKWVPILSYYGGDKEFWHLIFVKVSEESVDIHWSLVGNCAIRWSEQHMASCLKWILSQQSTCVPWNSTISYNLLMRFLILSSDRTAINSFDFSASEKIVDVDYNNTQEQVVSILKMAFDGIYFECEDLKRNLDEYKSPGSEISLPDWLILILSLCKIEKSSLDVTVAFILEYADRNPSKSFYPLALLLRLYLLYSSKMNFSQHRLRQAIIQASKDNHLSWFQMRCSLDCQISEMFVNLTQMPHPHLMDTIIGIAKQHPLFIIRHLGLIHKQLLDDGLGVDGNGQPLMKRGRIETEVPEGHAIAEIGKRKIKVVVSQWGYSFNEVVWSSMLEILLSLPVDILFLDEKVSGLEDILVVFVRLFITQIEVLNSRKNIACICGKFITVIDLFKINVPKRFDEWVSHWGQFLKSLPADGI